jgi:4-methylaminobutanoate oxidase (formaldehyde-forming)
LCTNTIAVEAGRTVYTGMLNRRGGYEADVTVTRTGPEEFLMVSSAASTERDLDHLRRRVLPGSNVAVLDVTGQYAVYGVMGPRSRELLESLSRSDFGDAAFPFGSSREVDLGYSTVRATRLTYVGELGWELYVPAEFAVGVHEDLTAAGERFGLADAGYYAIESLRLEKAYRAFGRELTPDHSPVEAGLLFACKLGTGTPFLGREAVEAARAKGPARRLVSLVAEDPEVMLWGGELVLRDGVPAGQVTSAAWGAAVGAAVGLAYLWRPDGGVVDAGYAREGRYEVDVAGVRVGVAVGLRAPFDPGGDRVRGEYAGR